MTMDVFFPPGPAKNLFLGNAPQFQDNPFQFMLDSARQYGEIVHFRFGPTHAYLLSNPTYSQAVLVDQADKFAETPNIMRAINSAFGHDLTAPKEKYKRLVRRTPLFQARWLADFTDDVASRVAEGAASWADGQPRNIVSELKRLTQNVTGRVLFDSIATDVTGRIAEDIFFSRQLSDRRFVSPLTLPEWIPTRTNRKQQTANSSVDSFIKQMIADHRAQPGRYDGVLARLIESADLRGGTLEAQVRDEALALFLAGHETTANTLAWALYLLATNPEAEALLHAEVDSVLGGRLPAADDLDKLVYAEMIIRETLRLYPPAWLVNRQAKQEIKIGKYFLPSGSSVFISPYIIHHNPRYFADPESFIPERFVDGFDRRMPRYAYMPFGAGARATVEHAMALGQAKLLLATIAARCRVTMDEGQVVTPEAHVTLRPQGTLTMRLHAREAAQTTEQVQ